MYNNLDGLYTQILKDPKIQGLFEEVTKDPVLSYNRNAVTDIFELFIKIYDVVPKTLMDDIRETKSGFHIRKMFQNLKRRCELSEIRVKLEEFKENNKYDPDERKVAYEYITEFIEATKQKFYKLYGMPDPNKNLLNKLC